ncbi:MAG TPA: regulatory iron-sulfur-containing complex subunit RicT [Chitinophagaceae bacterium]|nr:regulatory iron-sulfur-containing complex subunit RicT [Chitinophagaceae bacterium]
MPYGSCGTKINGNPASTKKYCSGGCNKREVYDWLADIPQSDQLTPFNIVEISFNKGSRKEFFRNTMHQTFQKGQMLAVEGVGGFDVGQVSLSGELVRLQMKRKKVNKDAELKKILRTATESDLEAFHTNKDRQKAILVRSRVIARKLELKMKITEIDMQADGKKATFYYTADSRVDFRQLIREYASEFHVKVEMRQIGARQEAAKLGGVGACGRELCCASWLHNMKSVSTSAARYQNLSINQSKLSGLCGRLKCCLNFELDMYLDALQHFPNDANKLQTEQGTLYLQKKDIFKELMWYSYTSSHKQYPLSIKRVLEIQKMNKSGEKVEDLDPVVLESKKGEEEHSFVDVVGQISLNSLERGQSKKGRGKRGRRYNKNNKRRNNRRRRS